mmetsp:Transcript_32243/g.70626  ORF Transcript_32243/g.70626 Transcript_32243/m.70626 type:complete len:259 (+) Transcript_32243:166-942(+)|eukprot:CAMPEP_0204275188 /NCGR_PEP_ID=MMETSP0468-20130131/25610_1 /ASSEMBLY_ACC=CAM_ASM_000383 /TAXON_ID=2969 /ORGANISM="Oxyrrhis marina" /LENGTH=258 /DNA_ID=CAMNT_0051251489 /DNA_START=152 /DNA_END=928 /DNA_ORIENTATION=+
MGSLRFILVLACWVAAVRDVPEPQKRLLRQIEALEASINDREIKLSTVTGKDLGRVVGEASTEVAQVQRAIDVTNKILVAHRQEPDAESATTRSPLAVDTGYCVDHKYTKLAVKADRGEKVDVWNDVTHQEMAEDFMFGYYTNDLCHQWDFMTCVSKARMECSWYSTLTDVRFEVEIHKPLRERGEAEIIGMIIMFVAILLVFYTLMFIGCYFGCHKPKKDPKCGAMSMASFICLPCICCIPIDEGAKGQEGTELMGE